MSSSRYALKQDVVGFHARRGRLRPGRPHRRRELSQWSRGESPKEHAGTYESVLEIPAEFLAPIPYEIRLRPAIFGHRELLTAPIGVFVAMQGGGRVNSALPGYKTVARITPLLPCLDDDRSGWGAPPPGREDV